MSRSSDVFELKLENARDFKFSAAHFTAHGSTRERLHGHNYTLSVSILGAAGADGCVLEFSEVKVAVRALAAELDERFLCATHSSTVTAIVADEQLTLRVVVDGSLFSMPLGDAVLLPLSNTTVEELSAYFARKLVERIGAARLLERGVTSVTLGVAESPGQEARFTVSL